MIDSLVTGVQIAKPGAAEPGGAAERIHDHGWVAGGDDGRLLAIHNGALQRRHAVAHVERHARGAAVFQQALVERAGVVLFFFELAFQMTEWI